MIVHLDRLSVARHAGVSKMKLPSKKKIAITAFTIAALGLLALVGVLVAVRRTHRPKVTISVDDLAEMKTLVHEYLNERARVNFFFAPDPDSNPNVAGAPVIDPSEMSPGLAARQREDVEKLKAGGRDPRSDDFRMFTRVLDIDQQGDEVTLRIYNRTYYNHLLPGTDTEPSIRYLVDGCERFYTFKRKGDGWVLEDVKLLNVSEPPFDEPNVEPFEKGTARVLAKPPDFVTVIPEEIQKLDEAATRKILNEWTIDLQTREALDREMESKPDPVY
ncbi:MAG: hypothetical protein KKE79_04340 [Actinobacteria bacterium]|nr:hypothetical protein [Actinomycetota bacterium]MBU4489845.1 hypothetical protein [Actinomycetota bacterium]MCG2795350.1 hypothetical protein [Actinomycetes bacterium]